MAWYNDLIDSVSSVFSGGSSGGGTTVPSSNSSGGSSFWDSNLLKSVTDTGLGLAGIYFQQSQQKKLAEQAAKMKLAEIAAAKGGGGGGGGGSAMRAAKMQTLAQLYANYAELVNKGGTDVMEGAIKTADVATAPIIARLQGLK